MSGQYLQDMIDLVVNGYIDKDLVIVGGGPSGLTACYLASKHGLRSLLIEKKMYYGGFMWYSSFMGSVATLATSLTPLLDELGVDYEYSKDRDYLLVSTPILLGRLISRSAESGCSMVNLAEVTDLLITNNRVSGIRGGFIDISKHVESYTQYFRDLDLVVYSRYVILTTGIDLNNFESKLYINNYSSNSRVTGNVDDVELLRDLILSNTKEVIQGLVIAGAAIVKMLGLSGLTRLGYGIPMESAIKAIDIVIDKISEK